MASKQESNGQEPIAIVGMGMRLPGGVSTADAFWDMLVEGKEGRVRVPADRYNIDSFYNAHGKNGCVKTEYGHFLQSNLKHVDTSFFTMTRTETEKLDPQARLLLEVTREALENAGETGWRNKDIATFVGVFGEDWQDIHQKDSQDAGMYRVTGYGDFLLGNRIAYEYDLKGPSMTIKTGCSSSLICLHMACQALLNNECPAAVVAGTNLIMSPTMTIAMSEQGVLSSGARCKTFDETADGYARGEAINVLYVKKLSDAIRDGNPVQAIIRATATNCDGKTPGISHPSSEAHEALLRQAHHFAGLEDFTQTAFIECHGTGTAVGDPLETAAVARLVGEKGIYVGSHKPNVGHSEGASGITGVIKGVLALQHKIIPPNVNFAQGNHKIDFDCLKVPTVPTAWPTDRAERVCVNSFGLGGSNATVVLDSAASFGIETQPKKVVTPSHKLLVYSANHTDSLTRLTDNYTGYLEQKPDHLADLAYTLGARREHLPFRTFKVTDGTNVSEGTAGIKPTTAPEVNFVFTGQGAQWLGMAGDLLKEFPAALADIKEMDKALQALPHPPSWTIEQELLGDASNPDLVARFGKAEFAQPLCTAIQVVMVNLLKSWGITATGVVGHSSGEICGAFAAGAISMADAIGAAYYRGYATQQQKRKGGMAAIGLSSEEVQQYLLPGTVVACENSPSSVTLSGDLEQLDLVVASIKEKSPGTFARSLVVEMAYHSHHMKEIGKSYQDLLHFEAKKPTIPFFSSVTGEIETEAGALGPAYWRANLESTVLFSTAAQKLLATKKGEQLFFEIGPHSALQGPLRQIFKAVGGNSPAYVSALLRNTNSAQTLLSAVGQLYQKDVKIDLAAMNANGNVLIDLPNYPWYYDTEYWDESRVSSEWRLRKFPHHDVLGNRITENSDLEPAWRNMLRLDEVAWIRDHQVSSDIVFPGAGYMAMAGEAMRQLSGKDDFTIKAVTISAAMVMNETHATEVVTTFRPVKLTTALDSVWYEFTIASHNGSNWTKHCNGQIRAGPDHELVAPEMVALPREVNSPRWYQALKKVGLNYGPRFQGLTKISAGTDSSTAIASMINNIEVQEATYQLHPSTIDLCIQLFAAAASKGLPRNLKTLSVPTFIEQLYIAKPEGEMTMFADALVTPRGTISGDGIATCDGRVVLEMKGLKLFPLDDDNDDRGSDPHAAASIHWKPDFDFLEVTDLVKPSEANTRDYYWDVERLAVMMMIETKQVLAGLTGAEPHFDKYQAWMDYMTTRAANSELVLVENSAEMVAWTSEERRAKIDGLIKKIMDTPTKDAAIALSRIFTSVKEIFEGSTDALQVLLPDDILTKIYDMGDRWDHSAFFHRLSHAKPWLRVLEIGAGTGGTSMTILKQMISEQGERMYAQYDYTDISSGFFSQAKERFAEFPKMVFSVLDVTKDPAEQGFELGSYDLIVATNVLHATPDLNVTLKNVHKLLKPDGQLFLDELICEAKWINYIMGNFDGWWLGDVDGRPLEPYVQPSRWAIELEKAGFQAPAVIYDDELPYASNALIIASPVAGSATKEKKITLLCESKESLLVAEVEAEFKKDGYAVEFCGLSDAAAEGSDIVSLLDLEKPFFENISEENYKTFLAFLDSLKFSAVLWLSRASQVNCTDPRWAQVLGVMRAVRNELAIDIATLELDDLSAESAESVIKVWNKFNIRDKSGDYEPDFEFALSQGEILIPRFHWLQVTKELSKAELNKAQGSKRLEIGRRGALKTLGWVQMPVTPVLAGEVELDVRAVGMNFKDVLIAMGIVEGHMTEGNGLGCECAGVITQVGPGVENVAVGDRVIVFAGGSYSTKLITDSRLCAKMPDNLSFQDGATMPCVYSTVIHSLLHLGRLTKRDTVLIQSACGGIGISAIQVAKMIGAEIYCTVGTEDKVQYLMNTFGIQRDHIFNSRNASFLPDVLKATKGRGVDVVLNSLSGELLHASWKCVAKHGKMVEIGKRDFIGRAKLSMEVFESNRSFFGVDFAEICAERRDITQDVMEECMGYYAKGLIGAVGPITHFDAVDIEAAFRFMQKGAHIGKIVVTMPEDSSVLKVADIAQDLSLRSDATYLMVGGLGGLGKAISTWMVDHGAKSLLYLSRSAGKTAEDQQFFAELQSQGCAVTAVPGSVNKLEDVQKAIAAAPSEVAGCLQMSMVLRDGPLPEMSFEDWETAVTPKVQGTWNLHEALAGSPLDFLVLFSSSSGLVGQRGQTNYASANTFLDAFVQYRHANGLAASVIDIGPVEEIGYLSTNKMVLDQFRATSVHTLQEQDVLDSLQLIIRRSSPVKPAEVGYTNASQIGIGLRMTQPVAAPGNRCIWKRDVRMAVYRNIEQVEEGGDSSADPGLRQFLSASEADPASLATTEAKEFLAKEMGTTLYGFLLLPIEGLDITAPIANLGIDSLVAIELRNWCRHKLGIEMTVLEILDFGTLEDFGEIASQRLSIKFGGGGAEEAHRDAFLANKAP